MLFLDNSPLPEVSFSFLDQNGQIIFTQRTLRGQRSPVPTLRSGTALRAFRVLTHQNIGFQETGSLFWLSGDLGRTPSGRGWPPLRSGTALRAFRVPLRPKREAWASARILETLPHFPQATKRNAFRILTPNQAKYRQSGQEGGRHLPPLEPWIGLGYHAGMPLTESVEA